MKKHKEKIITKEYLLSHENEIFVFGDNLKRVGLGGAAALRYFPNTYGFITKKYPSNEDESFYTIEEYRGAYEKEIVKIKKEIISKKDKTFLISKLGAGLANRYQIFEKIIEPNIKKDLSEFKNVKFLW